MTKICTAGKLISSIITYDSAIFPCFISYVSKSLSCNISFDGQ